LASAILKLVETIGDPVMTVGLLPAAAQAKYEAGEMSECLEFADRVIDAADGDAAMGNFMVASPLAWAISLRGAARMCLGRPGWRADFEKGLAMTKPFDIQSRANMALYKYAIAIQNGAELVDTSGLVYSAEWLKAAESTGDPTAITLVSLIRGVLLANSASENGAPGIAHLEAVYDQLSWLTAGLRRIADVEIARYRASSGDLDGAIVKAQEILDEAFDTGEMFTRGASTTVLVEALLARNAEADLTSAQAAIDRLAAVSSEPRLVIHELPLLRLRALMARAQGDEAGYAAYVPQYRELAEGLGFMRHKVQAAAM
jgi:adenylate cyclase